MSSRFDRLWPVLILLVGVGYQCLVHSAVLGGQTESVRIGLAFLPLLVLACWVAVRADNKVRWFFILLAAGMAVYILEHQQRWGPAAAYGIPHAVIYSSLLWLFGQTLCHRKEPIVTRLARRVHGTLPPELIAYTRRVTWAWCVFFTGQMIVSALLFKFASPNVWSLFINFLNFPLLVLMFAGEYAYRVFRHPEFPHASILAGIRAFSNDAESSTSAKT